MFGRIGQRLGAFARLGGRVLQDAGSVGQRVTSLVGKGLDTVGAIPLIGGAFSGSPPVQALRGLVTGAEQVSGAASGIGAVLEKGGMGIQALSR